MSQNDSPHDEAIPELPDELNLFASQLEQFKPREQAGVREEFFFKAGQESVRAELATAIQRYKRVTRIWQTAASLLLVASIGLGVTLASRHESQNVLVINSENDVRTHVETSQLDHAHETNHSEQQEFALIPVDCLRTRQKLIAQSDEAWAGTSAQSEAGPAAGSHLIQPQSANLDSGSLLRGIPAQILIRRVMEDSTL